MPAGRPLGVRNGEGRTSGQRERPIGVLFNPAELALVEDAAKAEGMPRATWLRRAALREARRQFAEMRGEK